MESAGPERHPLAQQVEEFLKEFGVSRMSFDNAVYVGFTERLLAKNARPRPKACLAAELHMTTVRADEAKKLVEACKFIRAVGGYITMSPGGSIEHAPANVPEPRLRRMIADGLLVATGDTLIDGVPSQSYKLSAIAP
jgi:hypothetical protein